MTAKVLPPGRSGCNPCVVWMCLLPAVRMEPGLCATPRRPSLYAPPHHVHIFLEVSWGLHKCLPRGPRRGCEAAAGERRSEGGSERPGGGRCGGWGSSRGLRWPPGLEWFSKNSGLQGQGLTVTPRGRGILEGGFCSDGTVVSWLWWVVVLSTC